MSKGENEMKVYIFKRTLRLFTTFLGAVAIIYFIFMAVPGNFVDGIMDPKLTQDRIDKLNEKYHFNKSKSEQFIYWIKGAAHGDLGSMYVERLNAKPTPVAMVVKFSAISTLKMMFLTMLTSIIIAIPLALKAADKAGKTKEKVIKALTTVGISLPAFIIALILLHTLKSNRFAISYFLKNKKYDEYNQFIAFIIVNIIPFIVLNLVYIANIVNYGYVSLAEIVKSEYIKCAYAMGLKKRKILYKYTLRNGLIPIITILGTSFPVMFCEVLVIESAIGRPGLGSLMLSAVRQRQYNVLMAIILVSTIITLISNYIVDMLYFVADPRVKFQSKKA